MGVPGPLDRFVVTEREIEFADRHIDVATGALDVQGLADVINAMSSQDQGAKL